MPTTNKLAGVRSPAPFQRAKDADRSRCIRAAPLTTDGLGPATASTPVPSEPGRQPSAPAAAAFVGFVAAQSQAAVSATPTMDISGPVEASLLPDRPSRQFADGKTALPTATSRWPAVE